MALTDELIDEEWFEVHHLNINNTAKAKLFARAIESAACAERDHEIAVLKQCLFQAQEAAKDLACQLADARKDAERWRFVYDPQSDGYAVCEYFHDGWIPISTDCVDAAMQKG